MSCAAVELLKSPKLEHAEALAKSGCLEGMTGENCHATASLLAHSCNEKHSASCLTLAELFEKAKEPDSVWASHYHHLSCLHGGFCAPAAPSGGHTRAAE